MFSTTTLISLGVTAAGWVTLLGFYLWERHKRLGAEGALQSQVEGENQAAADAIKAEEAKRVAAEDEANTALQDKWAKNQEEAKKNEDVQAALDKFRAARSKLRGDS